MQLLLFPKEDNGVVTARMRCCTLAVATYRGLWGGSGIKYKVLIMTNAPVPPRDKPIATGMMIQLYTSLVDGVTKNFLQGWRGAAHLSGMVGRHISLEDGEMKYVSQGWKGWSTYFERWEG